MWNIMKYYELLWYVMKYYEILWNTMILSYKAILYPSWGFMVPASNRTWATAALLVSAAVCRAVPTDVERAAFQVEIMVKMSKKHAKPWETMGKSMNIIYFVEPFSWNVGLPKAMANMVKKLGPGESSPVQKTTCVDCRPWNFNRIVCQKIAQDGPKH